MLRILIAAIIIGLIGLAVWFGEPSIPDRWKPWAPLRLDDEPNLFTSYKLRRLRGDPQQCFGLLEQAHMKFTKVPDADLGKGCEYRNAVRIESSDIAYSNRFMSSCNLAASLALFERHGLQPAAMDVFGQPVAKIEHLGSYACRNVNNRETGALSEHAGANAIDLSAFVLKDGTRISVLADWPGAAEGGSPKGDFLRRVRDGACRYFRTVLGPDYNSAHHNHFHVDMGRHSICR